MGEVADLWATLGARVDQRAWAAADARIAAAQRATDGVGRAAQRAGRRSRAAGEDAAAGAKRGANAVSGLGGAFGLLGAYIGGRAAYGALIKFNGTMEDARNQIAGMLSLAKKTDLADQFGPADTAIANLTKRASTLPGTTAEYIAMLGNLAQPIGDAGLNMQMLEDITVGAAVAAKALGIDAQVAARDIDQAIRGQFHSVDQFTGKLLGAAGFKGEEGRARFNAMTQKQRAEKIKEVTTQKQITQLAEAQGKTFSGVMSTLQDSLQQFFGKVGKPLFEGLTAAIKGANAWLEANQETLKEIAEVIGGALRTAFDLLGAAFTALAENLDVALPILAGIAGAFLAVKIQAAAAWLAAMGPLVLLGATIAATIALIVKLRREPERVKAAFRAMWEGIKGGAAAFWEALKAVGERIVEFFVDDIPSAIKAAFKAAFDYIASLPVIKQLLQAMRWALGLKAGASSIGDALNPADLARKMAEIQAAGQAAGTPAGAPTLPPAAAASTASYNSTVNVGDINVTSSSADPTAVAVEVRRAVADEIGGMLRRTRDVVG